MNKKMLIDLRTGLIFLIVLAVVGLAACERPLSGPVPTQKPANPPSATPAGGKALISTPTQAVMPTIPVLISSPTPTPLVEPTVAAPTAVMPTAAPVQPPATAAPSVVQPAPTTAPSASAVVRPQTYSLHSGEFPYCLARRFDVDPIMLLNMNGLYGTGGPYYGYGGMYYDPYRGWVRSGWYNEIYYPGMELAIPQFGAWKQGPRALRPHPAQYTVGWGDTVYSVACFFGDVDPQAIAQANGQAGPYQLTPGTTINIP